MCKLIKDGTWELGMCGARECCDCIYAEYTSQLTTDTLPHNPNGDRKDTTGKLCYTCFSWQALEETAKIFQEAKRKYGNNDSWRLSGPESIPVYQNALQRHLIELHKGNPDYYTETINGVDYHWRHSAQIIWNALALCHKQLEKEGKI